MKILLVNKFLYPKGGDAISTFQTGDILSLKGHEVAYWGMSHPSNPRYPLENLFVDYVDYNVLSGKFAQFSSIAKILYSFEAKRKLREVLKVFRPDIVHLNNFAHQISPSILDVLKAENIPAVMTMHDYKIACPSYSLLQSNTLCVCNLCFNGAYYHCFFKKCVKDSYLKSLVNTIEMCLHHKIWHIYDYIHTFIAPSQFLKEQIESMGFKGRIVVISNSLNIAKFTPRYDWQEKYIVFLGRLDQGKGLFTMIKAFDGIMSCSLKIIGDGPLRGEAEVLAQQCKPTRIDFLGYKTGQELVDLVRNAMFVLLPSEWYENNPRSIIEAFALGKPVIGAKIGGIPELVRDNETGFTFAAGDSQDLKTKIEFLLSQPELIIEFGKNARSFAERKLDMEKYYISLLGIYNQAIEGKLHREK